MLGQVPLGLQGRGAPVAGRPDRLPVDLVGHVAGHKNSRHLGRGSSGFEQVTVFVHGQLALEGKRVRLVPDGHEDATYFQTAFRSRLHVGQPHRFHFAVGPGEIFSHRAVPDRFDLRVGQDAVRHDLRGPQGVTAMDQVNF